MNQEEGGESMKTRSVYAFLALFVFCIYFLCSCAPKKIEDDTSFLISTDGSADVPETEIHIPDGMVTRYFSLSFDDRHIKAYDDVVDTVSHMRESALIPLTIPTREYSKVLETVRCEQLGFFFIDTRSVGEYNDNAQTFEINFTYKYTAEEINSMLAETEAEAVSIVSRTENMGSYEKVKYFHDYLARTVQSTSEGEFTDSVYGALVKKKALCEGFAKAFSYLCNLSGIDNMIVTGVTDIDHMWNMVKLNGNWYHVDVGWDQPAAALRDNYPDMLLYQYFLVSDDVIANHCTVNTELGNPPPADDNDMNYYIRENCYAKSYDEALDMIQRLCINAIDTGENYFIIKVDSGNLYTQVTAGLVKKDENGKTDADRIVRKAGYSGRIGLVGYYKDYRILIFLLD